MRLDADKDYLVCDYCGRIHVPDTNDDGVRILGEIAPSVGFVECPVCQVPLVHAALDGQRIHYCRRCRGMLIPIDIFSPVIEDLRSRRERPSELIRPLDASELDRPARCPQCRHQMISHVYGGGGNVVVSTCERCAVVWLDHGELDRIVRAPDRQLSFGMLP